MKMQTVRWLIFLALIKERAFQSSPIRFELPEPSLEAKEGSCIELKCTFIQNVLDTGARWVWLKNPEYDEKIEDYSGTVVYSSNGQSPDRIYEHRVSYPGPTVSRNPASRLCSILICNLNKSDHGKYAVRYYGDQPKFVWYTEPGITLRVTDNPCPITFVQPGAVKENDTISLTCSTPSTCYSNFKIEGLAQQLITQSPKRNLSTSFKATWKDDGKVISCQLVGNTDPYLIKNITLTVEYPLRDISARTTPADSRLIKEGRPVTLTCSANGQPKPTFTWLRNDGQKYSGAEWKFSSIKESDSGEYTCTAQSGHSSLSTSVSINVTYAPTVEVTTSSSSYIVTQDDGLTLRCTVRRSNPPPHAYEWFKDRIFKSAAQTYVIERVTHADKGRYTCRAQNTVDWGTSTERSIEVRYSPRNTQISISPNVIKVRVGTSVTFTCTTDANPKPTRYSWYRDSKGRRVVSSQWKSLTFNRNSQQLVNVQRADEACYMCNATNDIRTGDNSDPLCIQVLYPPTKPTLTMDSLVKEGQHTTISCTVESSPPSKLTLTRTARRGPPELVFTHASTGQPANHLQYTFNVSSADSGSYTCNANNDISSSQSDPKDMVVKYSPKDVTVQADPGKTIDENRRLTLRCDAHSYPPEMSFTWTKTGKSKPIGQAQTFTVQSVSPSDSGLYSCQARNVMGTGKSQEAQIQIRYAPKHTKITTGVEQLYPGGKKSLTLSCSSDGDPEPKQFSWHKKTDETDPKGKDQEVSKHQTYTVYSDQPGVYYCIAKNELNQKSSEPISVFVDRGIMKILLIIFLLIMLLTLLVFFFYRHRRNKAARQRPSNNQSFLSSLDWWTGSRSRLTNEQPFRSRDDLLPEQPCHSRQQPRPDSAPAPNINTVYSTVAYPAKAQAPSREAPIKQKAGATQDESLNYASLHFGKKQKNKKAKEETDVVYAMVSKKTAQKTEQEHFEDYENMKKAPAAKSPKPEDDSDTSEDDVELNYSQVSFKAKPGHQRARRGSSSSEDEIMYSDVKI